MAGSNPFSVFRKHQRQLLVWLGVLTMLSFVVIPAMMQVMPQWRQGSHQTTVAQCRKFGNIDQEALRNLQNE